MSRRSGGRSPAARSGHSSSTTAPSGRSSKPSSASSPGRNPIEVGMNQREARQFIVLHKRESRAWHLDGLVAGEVADQRAREGGFAGAKIARQRHQIAGLERGRRYRSTRPDQRFQVPSTAPSGKSCRMLSGASDSYAHPALRPPSCGGWPSGKCRSRWCPRRHRGNVTRAAMQLDERAHQRQADAGAAMMRAERMGLEPVEYLVQHVGRNSRPAVGNREHDRASAPPLGDEA